LREFWARTLGGDDALRHRLDWDDLDERALPAILADVSEKDLDHSEWIDFLTEALHVFGRDEPCAGSLSGVPFIEFFSAFASVALERLRASSTFGSSDLGLSLSEKCWDEVAAFLARRLAPIGAGALHADFARYRQAHDPAAEKAETYAEWVGGLRAGGAATLLGRYPVLARALSTLSLDAVSTLQEWWDRLTTDWPDLRSTFGLPAEIREVTSLRLGLSDRHYQGRQALAFAFSSGAQLIYKPKSIDLDAALGSLLLNLRDASESEDAFPAPVRTLSRPSYGWVEVVAQHEFRARAEVAGYYRRCGGLLAVVYALEGRDFTMDNVVATQNGPAAIDAETLMQPLCRPGGSEGIHGQALDTLTERILRERDYSVLDTGLLPAWHASAEQVAGFYDVSGIGGQSGYSAGVLADTWADIGTTRMGVVRRPVEVPPELNGVSLNGQPCPAGEFVSEITAGFIDAGRLLIRLRDAPDGWLQPMLQSWRKAQVRLLLRATGIYGRTLQQVLEPSHLTHPVLAGALVERLWKPFLRPGPRPFMAPFLREEAVSLLRLDIPCFHLAAHGDSRSLFLFSPLEMGLQRLKTMSESNLHVQQRILRNTFALPPRLLPRTFDRTVALQEALEIAKMMELSDGEGSAVGVSVGEFGMESAAAGAAHARAFLYDGRLAGRSLFYAALAKITGDPMHRERALHALESLWQITGGDAQFRTDAATLPIGAATGLGSVIYTFLTAGRILDVASCRTRASAIASLITQDVIDRDAHFDVLCGAAGAAMVLAHAAAEGDPNDLFRERAIWCGEHLLKNARAFENHQGLWWRGTIGECYLGYGHGAAGIAAALARVAVLTGDTRFRTAAQKVFDALEQIFSESKGAWPVLVRDGGETLHRNMESLCHGSAGIALAAVEAQHCGVSTHRTASRALQILAQSPPHAVDTLCCGNIGRMEGLLALCDQGGAARADELAVRCLGRREPCGIFRTSLKRSEHWTLPSPFFRGLSGIGYTLLRMGWPDDLPAAARWR
jgi:type 2 lantibiotic biosynthesis protein LanM